MAAFAELCVTTNFSFLRGGSHPEEMVEQARDLGLAGVGIADRCTLAGVVRAHVAAKEHKVRLIVGARLVFVDGSPDVLAYPKDRAAYGRLCRLLTIGNRRAPKGECHLELSDLLAHADGLQMIVLPALAVGAPLSKDLIQQIVALREQAGAVWLAIPAKFDGEDRRRRALYRDLVAATGARTLATSEPLMHVAERRALLDVVTCIREGVTLESAGTIRAVNAERHLKTPDEMGRLFSDAPDAIEETVRFLDGIRFSLDDLRYEYPDETRAQYADPQETLDALAWEGARRRYPRGAPRKISEALERELAIIKKIKYAPYFLTVEDIVRYARDPSDKEPILCQGRGSAANSTVCYCLGITEVDPSVNELLFDRFVSEERNEPPDIDVDFEHERREEVIQYIYTKYGRERAGLAATLICYRGRSALREVAKVFGYSEDRITALTKTLHWWSHNVSDSDLKEQGLDLSDIHLRTCLNMARELQGFPRHLSQHVGGFVITRGRLDELIPIQNAAMEDRTVVEWDKDDLDALGILKVDVLGLGMLTCLKKAFDLLETKYGLPMSLSSVPREDPRTYKMLQRADSIGVFQVESRAQMTMLPRLKPERFYDLVIEVAIVRPGPIQGGMVHPYLARRTGKAAVNYPSPELEAVLQRTLGVPLFQEQAMQIAIVAAGFTPSEADKLRRAMATFRRVGTIGQLKSKFIEGMVGRGYERDFAERSFSQIEGFGEYGFPESHAASFALLVYASSWIKCHYPDVFAAALLNAQPMGFYAPAQIVRDAAEHGVEVRAPDINRSDWDNTLEEGEPACERLHARHSEMGSDVWSRHSMRLGFRQVKGLREDDVKQLVARRGEGYDSVRDVWLRSGLSTAIIETLADGDAFRSIGLDRRDALWAARGLNRVGGQDDLPLFVDRREPTSEPDFALPRMCLGEHIVEDYRSLSLSLKAHPTALLRQTLAARQVVPAESLASAPNGKRVRVAGLVLVRQRPGTASGVIFMTLEDETSVANIVVWPKVFEKFRAQVLGARLCAIEGVVQSESGVIHVVAEKIADWSDVLVELSGDTPFENEVAHADEVRHPGNDQRTHPRKLRIDLSSGATPSAVMPKGRNFH